MMIHNHEPYRNTNEFTLLEAAYIIANEELPADIINTPLPHSVQLVFNQLGQTLRGHFSKIASKLEWPEGKWVKSDSEKLKLGALEILQEEIAENDFYYECSGRLKTYETFPKSRELEELYDKVKAMSVDNDKKDFQDYTPEFWDWYWAFIRRACEELMVRMYVRKKAIMEWCTSNGYRPPAFFPELRPATASGKGETGRKENRGRKPDPARKKVIGYMKERLVNNESISISEIIKGMDDRKIDHSKWQPSTLSNMLSKARSKPHLRKSDSPKSPQ